MVFCYKIITESPNRSYNVSPRRKCSTGRRLLDTTTLLTELPNVHKDVSNQEVFSSIPEREWRLLDVLAKKRDEDETRKNLAHQFHKLWQKEKEDREQAEAETAEQYKRYIQDKREFENYLYVNRKTQKTSEQNFKKDLIEHTIRTKEERSKDLLAWINEAKNNLLLDKSLDSEARRNLAADRRSRQFEAQRYMHELAVLDTTSRLDKARRKRYDNLRDTSQRMAIQNALTTWGANMYKQESEALDYARRAKYAYHAALTEEKSIRLERARQARLEKSRRVAQITRLLRDVVKNGRL